MNQQEIWKDIKGYETKYQVSNIGQLRTKKDNKILKFFTQEYHSIKLTNNDKERKSFLVHRIVADHFVDNPDQEKYNVVDHINNNKQDNRAINLRWTNQSTNMKNFADNFREYTGIPIIQYDLTGKNIVKKWKDIKEILSENPTYKYGYIISRMANGKICYGYIWKYNKPEKLENLENNEVFLNIGNMDGYDFSNYEISNFGKIRSLKTNKILKPNEIKGYHYTHLYDKITKNPIDYQIHRLVALSFVAGRTAEKDIVNHLDKNKTNNHQDNLEWTSIQGNTAHAVGKKVQQIDINTGEVIKVFDTVTEAYKSFGKPCNSHISMCCKGKKIQTLGFKWRYID